VKGISKIDLDSVPASDGTFYRVRVNASGTRLSFPGSGLDVVKVPEPSNTLLHIFALTLAALLARAFRGR
jgi:hypothetical protein